MAKIHGRLSNFLWNAVALNGIVDQGFSMERPSLDSTTHDTGDAREFIAGRLAGTIDFTLKWDEADSAQGSMQTDFFAGTSRSIDFRMNTGGGLHKFTGTGLIENWSPSGPNDDVAEVSCTIRISGAITEDTQ